MSNSVNYLLSKLKVLSKVQSGQKLMIEDSKIQIMECDKNNWDRFIKWWLGETRHTTLDKLEGFYLEIKDMISTLVQDPIKNQVTLERLSHELNASVRGLKNLMLTYQYDRTIVSQLETLAENFDLEIKRVLEVINEYHIQPENVTVIEQHDDDSSESAYKPLI